MIHGLGNYIPDVAKTNTKQQLVDNKPIPKKNDDVIISSKPSDKYDIKTLVDIVNQYPDIREDKIQLAKERIRSKYYDDNIDGIVDSLIIKL